MCICELQLHRRVKGRRDDKGLGYTTAPINSAHRVIVYAGRASKISKLLLAAAKGACPVVSLEAPERAMLMDMRRARPFPVFWLDAASVLQAASARQLL